jgi:hypothetical protein
MRSAERARKHSYNSFALHATFPGRLGDRSLLNVRSSVSLRREARYAPS